MVQKAVHWVYRVTVRMLEMLPPRTAACAAWISLRKGPLWVGGTCYRNLKTVVNI